MCLHVFDASRQLCSSPFDKDLVCTRHGIVEDNKSHVRCHLWRLGEENDSEPASLQDVCPLPHDANVRWLAS